MRNGSRVCEFLDGVNEKTLDYEKQGQKKVSKELEAVQLALTEDESKAIFGR